MIPFDPLFRNPHLQTIAAHLWARDGEEVRFPLDRRLYRTEPGVEVLVQSQRPTGAATGGIVMVHGLEGSGKAGYVRGLSGAGQSFSQASGQLGKRSQWFSPVL